MAISTALQSQTFNKRNTWQALRELGIVKDDLSKEESDRLLVEGWWIGVRVILKRSVKHILQNTQKGFSTIVSWKNIFKAIFNDSWRKSSQILTEHIQDNKFKVESFQNREEYHIVKAYPTGLQCSCMKYKCIKNRLDEAPQLKKEFKLSDYWKLERYNEKTNQLEITSSPFCHHILAVVKKEFDSHSLQEYNWKYKEIIEYLDAKACLFPY